MTVFSKKIDENVDKGVDKTNNVFNTINANPIVSADMYRFFGQTLIKKDPTTGKMVSKDFGKYLKAPGRAVSKAVNFGIAKPINTIASRMPGVVKPFKFYSRAMDAIGLASLPPLVGQLGWEFTKAVKNRPPANSANKSASLSVKERIKEGSLDLRPAESYEVPIIYDECTKYPEEFVLDSPKAYEMMADRLAHQDTYILGDTANMIGFMNGGYRELPTTETTPYYIRFVHTNPREQGQGVAGYMLDRVMSKTASRTGYWMQICQSNKGMQKVASRAGFRLIDEWPQKNVVTGIWYKE